MRVAEARAKRSLVAVRSAAGASIAAAAFSGSLRCGGGLGSNFLYTSSISGASIVVEAVSLAGDC